MKKIAILSATNIKHMSLISLYTEILNNHNVPYDIIYMDKYDEDEPFECAHKYRYVNLIGRKWPKIFKRIKYMMFVPYAIRILRRNKYDFIIVWNDVAIFMFAEYLGRFMKGKYCLNVRDDMEYRNPLYKRMYKRCFANSAFNTISSKGYLTFLPKSASYIPINSLNLSVLKGMKIHERMRQNTEPIRIGYIGYVRFFERNQQLMEIFANDPRFELHYYGKNANVLKEYAEQKGIKNTAFHDSFPVQDTKQYLEKIDIINNLYGNETVNLRTAISIKFFHALYSRIPILVNTGTYIGEIATQLGVGFYVERIDDKTLPDRLFAWYRKIEFEKLNKACDKFLEDAMKENAIFEKIVVDNLCK